MTDITSAIPAVATRSRPAHHRSPIQFVADGARRVLRSYSETLANDQFIVPNGRMSVAARQLPAGH